MQLKLNIGMFCALLWSIFGERCNYYKELVKFHRILDRKECFTIRDPYTKQICTRITWAIINDGQSFFSQNPVALDFAQGRSFQFSVLCLESITDAVRNALPIQRATFPKQWTTSAFPKQAVGGQQIQSQHQLPLVPPPAGWPMSPSKPPGQQGSPKQAAPKDIRLQKIRLLMDPCLLKYNDCIDLLAILTSSGKRMGDLPLLPQYCTPMGTPLLCWNNVLGHCFRGKRCKFFKGHIRKGDVMDEFAGNVVGCISKGVVYYTGLPQEGTSPGEKQKSVKATADA
jgi:hypothetical protein